MWHLEFSVSKLANSTLHCHKSHKSYSHHRVLKFWSHTLPQLLVRMQRRLPVLDLKTDRACVRQGSPFCQIAMPLNLNQSSLLVACLQSPSGSEEQFFEQTGVHNLGLVVFPSPPSDLDNKAKSASCIPSISKNKPVFSTCST